MNIKNMIAFQTVDREGDIWCNHAMLFSTQEEVNTFFSNTKLVFETLRFEFEQNEDISDCIKLYKDNEGNVSGLDIEHEYCGYKKIRKMSVGHLILNS